MSSGIWLRSALPWLATLALTCAVAAVSSCSGEDPEGPGDVCDPDDDPPCPGAMSCEANAAGETVCQSPPGDPCDAAQGDLCSGASTCVALEQGGAQCGLAPGDPCDPAASPDPCVADYACVANEQDGTASCGIPIGGECDANADDPHCGGNLVCAELEQGGHACYEPVIVMGRVFDASTDAGIAGAHVLGLDDQATAVTDVAISVADGAYELDLPVARDADGAPIEVVFTLRASADGYQTFPGGIRTSLPISTAALTQAAGSWAVESALTDIALIALPDDQQGLGSIAGTVLAGDSSAGVLVVAEEGAATGISAISDKAGAYTIFNVPDGSYAVRGYAAGVQLEPASADVAGQPLAGVDLAESSAALGSISGNIQIVNAAGGSATSVVLVVESTFSDTFVRGEVPRGLRTPLSGPPNVTGDFTIDDVPAGRYVVLAAFENDDLVRDPDPNIAGTQIVRIEMASPGTAVTLNDSFKVTEALPLVGPGHDAPEAISGTPTFRWGDDSSEDFYSVVVYNAYGELVWEDPNVPGASGGGDVTLSYGGPALEVGMYYQFRVTSWRSPGGTPGPISQTEDLRGVFFVE